MADHTAAEVIAAIDIVAEIPDVGRLRSVLRTMRVRLEQRAEHDEAIGRAFLHRYGEMVAAGPDAIPAEVGWLIRAAVESTGATITEPVVDAELADNTAEEPTRD